MGMGMTVGLPVQGVVYWPVACGDCTTVVVDAERVVQVDIRDMERADDDEPSVAAVVDRLVECLPRRNGKPYLPTFILTHADKDHCLGFRDMLKRVVIGEIWATPRTWRDMIDKDVALCDDAVAFAEEVDRRVAATLKAVAAGLDPAAGDRLRVVGYDTDHSKHAYSELPAKYLSYPGDLVTMIDGEDLVGRVEIFIHAPFKDDCAAPRNETSLAFQLSLACIDDAAVTAKLLFFGDLAHETLMKIFTYCKDHDRLERLSWDALLAPHHCSKKVMFVVEDGKDVKKKDILDALEAAALTGATVVASCGPFPSSDAPGANPPHLKARRCYEAIAEDFRCTAEEPDADDPAPLIFALTTDGLALVTPEVAVESKSMAESGMKIAASAAAVGVLGAIALNWWRSRPDRESRQTGTTTLRDATAVARGDSSPPTQVVGFGR